jgi:hypothetical protein
MYKDLRTNVTFQSMAIDGFPVPQPEDLRYVHRSEILAYLNAYLENLNDDFPGLMEIRLNTNVESVSHGHGWSVISTAMGKSFHDLFDVVVVAIGAFHKPSGTDLHDPDFTGVSFHSLYYDDPSVLDDRTVLIVGGGNSARDVFWDAMERAKSVVLASPTEKDRNNVVFPGDEHPKVQEKATFIGRVRRITKDGTVYHTNWQGQDAVLAAGGIDVIVYCTGYKREFPFLSDEFQPVLVSADGGEVTNCYMYTAHKERPDSLFFFHPSGGRTHFNTLARETHAQARLIGALADRDVFIVEQLEALDETLQYWLDFVYTEWAKESLNSCSCVIHNPLFMNYMNAIVDNQDALANMADVRSGVMAFVRGKMREEENRKGNTIWHAGMELRVRADAVNWNLFRDLHGRLTAGPDIDGSEHYAVTWYLPDGSEHSTFHEFEIKYEDLILNDVPTLSLA